MKKIFSAFLLMTMMVASVGSFVSCSDIENAIANVEDATKDNAAAVEALKGEIAALKTALATAQADAAAAKTEANAAKQAAATAKAEAIAAALAEIEKVNGDVDAMQAVIDGINAALTGKADVKTVELLQATIDEYKALNDAAVAENATAIAALEEALAALGENVTPEQLAEVVAQMTAINEALVAFESRIQSVAYVPQSANAPVATQYKVGDKKSDYIIELAYQVSPVSAAAELENAEVYVKGLAFVETKAEAPVKYETKVVSVDEKTGMVEVIAYIPEKSATAEWDEVALALAIENENGVEISSAFETFAAEGNKPLTDFVTIKDFAVTYNKTNTKVTSMSYTHEMPYDTAIADTKVDMIDVEFVVKGGIFKEETSLADALEYLGIEGVEVVRNPENRFGVKYITVTTSKYDNGTAAKTDDFEVLKATVAADSKNVTAEFAEAYATVKDATKLIGQYVVVSLKEGFFTLAGDKLAATTVNYVVSAKKNPVTIEIEDIETPWLPVAQFVDVPYTGVAQKDFNAYHPTTDKAETTVYADVLDADGKPYAKATIVATSHDDMVVTLVDFTWPTETTTYTVKKEFNGAFDAKTKVQTVYNYDFTITVEGRPSDVDYEYALPTVPELELTPMPNPYDPSDLDGNKVEDLISWIEVGTMATDLAADYAEYYKEGVLAAAIAAELQYANWTVKAYSIDKDEDGAAIELENGTEPAFVFGMAKDNVTEASVIVFPYSVANYTKFTNAKALQLTTTITLNGVPYNVTVITKVLSWAKPATINLASGKFNPETLKGQNPITWTKYPFTWDESVTNALGVTSTVTHTYYVELPTASAAYNFGGAALNLGDYVKINAPAATDLDQYTLRIKMTTAPTYKVTNADGTKTTKYYYNEDAGKNNIPTIECSYLSSVAKPLYVAATAKADKIDAVAATATTPALNEVPAVKVGDNIAVYCLPASYLNNNIVISWNGSRVNNINIQVELVEAVVTSANIERIQAVSTKNANFTTPVAVAIETVATEAYEFKHGKACDIQLAKHIKVTDIFNQQVNNTYGTWADRWSNYTWKPKANATADYEGEYAVASVTDLFSTAYGQEVEFVNLVDSKGRDLGVKIQDTLGLELDKDFTFNETTGVVSINPELADLTSETTFTVRVKFTHMHDGFAPVYKNVTFKVVNAQ